MKYKRFLAAILTAALALSLVMLPASAIQSSFHDISDPVTAVNADILRLMGVVAGTGDGRFNPDGTLTRAQFCTMVVNFLQKGDEAARYATRTIFSDVTGSHWARSYINLAASYSPVKEGDRDIPLISGVGDGRFLPDSKISLAEAVTILLRALRYTSQQAGAVWPQGFMDLAASIGLTDGLPSNPGTSLNRAQAAQLFVNALKCKDADGKVYYESLGAVSSEPEIILAVNVETDDGSRTGAIRTTSNKNSEAYLPAHGDGNPVSLQGKRGHLVLNDREEIVTFVPDDSTATTITLSGSAQAAYVKAAGGQQYTISSTTPVYTSTAGQSTQYLEAYTSLAPGAQITLYSEKGKIVAVYATSGATTADSDAVVVMGNATAATFHRLTGGVSSFSIVKNRQPITLSQIKPYDVVTYDQLTNTLVVSDLRLTCIYKEPRPNPKTPLTVKAVDTEFEVLESAWDTIGDIKTGDSVSLLLTADGKVGGIVKSEAKTRSTAVGVVEGGSAQVFLPNGGTLKLSGTVSNASNVEGQLVIFSGSKDGFSASRLSENRAPGDFQIPGMKLGSYTVSSGVRVYERVSSGDTVAIDLADLSMDEIAADKVYTYHLNSSNMVDYIVLRDVTGNAYEYGMMVSTTSVIPPEYEADGTTIKTPERTQTSWRLIRGSGATIEFSSATGYNGRSGDIVAVSVGKDREGKDIIRSINKLTEVKNVKPSDFFESQGSPHVTVNGRTYRVADDVECFRNQSGSNRYSEDNWLTDSTGSSRLASIKAYSNNLTIYLDPVGQQVRVIAAN